MGSMHILEHIRIPRFDPNNPVHSRLAKLSEQAHEAAKVGDENRCGRLRRRLTFGRRNFGLTDDELRDIQQSLAELSETPDP
jgi:hypothetical protein